MFDHDRGTGRTTKQLKEAPQRAIFITLHTAAVRYTRILANDLGRTDLEIVPVDVLNNGERFFGRSISGIVIDHAVILSGRQHEVLKRVQPYIRRTIPAR